MINKIDSAGPEGIEAVRRSVRELNPAAVVVDANTIGAWTFNTGAGQTVADASASNNTLSLGASTAGGADDPVWVARP